MALRGGPLRSSASAGTVPGWRVEDFHHLETDFLEEGVVSGLAVSERGAGANMSIDVAAGLALIEITTTLLSPNATLKTYLVSDAVVNVAVPTADATNPRIDRIVAKFDMTIDPNGASSNIVSITLVTGTPAGSPSAPAEPSNAITLALVSVPASDTTIGNAQITDSRTFVTLDSAVLADIQRAATAITKTRMVFNDWTEKTIASGAITVDQVLHTVDTEADAASDDLDTITAQVGTGEIVVLKASHTDRTVVIKHNTGNIRTADGADFSLSDTDKSITLYRQSTTWYEKCRGTGGTTQPVVNTGTVTAAAANVGSSSTAENAMAPTWTGSNDMGSSKLDAAGAVAHVRLGINYRLDSGSLQLRVKVGGTFIGYFVIVTAGTASQHCSMDVWITARSVGGSGSLMPTGHIVFSQDIAGYNAYPLTADGAGTPAAAITRDTTASQAITVTAQFSASDADHFCNIQSGKLTISKAP